MRYYFRKGTLFLRGRFRAASTGTAGGLGDVPTVVVHAPPRPEQADDPLRVLERAIQREGLPRDFFGLFAGAPPPRLCILQCDFLTVFLIPGAPRPEGGHGDGISLVIYSGEGMSDAALLGALVTATAACMAALCEEAPPDRLAGLCETLVVACEGDARHQDASPSSEIGSRIEKTVRFGVRTVRERGRNGGAREGRPAFFIYSRYQGDHWAEWVPEECPYYPCHFPGQRCHFCYCPLYPCGDESLGQWVASSSNHGPVWNCSTCTLVHEPAVADYLIGHPEASLAELKAKKRQEKE